MLVCLFVLFVCVLLCFCLCVFLCVIVCLFECVCVRDVIVFCLLVLFVL